MTRIGSKLRIACVSVARRLYIRIVAKLRIVYLTVSTRLTTGRFLVLFALATLLVALVSAQCCQSALNDAEARALLTALAQILTTILAISVSLLLVSLQFVSQAYTPRMLRALLSDAIFVGYLATYAIAIFSVSGIILLNLAYPHVFLVYAYFILVFCVVYLIALLLHLPTTIHPINVIRRMGKSIPADFCQRLIERDKTGRIILGQDDEPFLALEQVLIRSAVENDFSSFLEGIKCLESQLANFLLVVKQQLEVRRTRDEVEKTSPVFSYFLRSYRQLAAEAISRRRELHLMYLCESLRRLMISLHTLKAHRAFQWTSELYDYCGLEGLGSGLLTFADDYAHQGLLELVKSEMRILDEPVYPFEGFDEKDTNLSEEERNLRTDRHIVYDLFRKRLDFTSGLAEKAAQMGLVSIVDSCLSALSAVVDKTLTLQPVERKRGVLNRLVAPAIVETHKKCVDRGLNPSLYTTDMLHSKIESLKKEEVEEFGLYVTIAYAHMGIYSVQKGFYEEVWTWGENGRYFVKNLPELAKIVIDVLTVALVFLKSRDDDRSRTFYSETRRELQSLRDWEDHTHKEIKKRIDKVLEKYPPAETPTISMELRVRNWQQQADRLLKQLAKGSLDREAP